jgi:4-hydroxybenzoyl-CoA reductase subunit beta
VQSFAYQSPTSLADVWSWLDGVDGTARLLAGGTDLIPALKRENLRAETLIDIKRVPELAGIEVLARGGLRIGALTTLHKVARSADVAGRFPILAEVAGTTASYQVRNRGTVGGNLCLDTRCSYFNQSPFWRAEYPDCRKMGGGSCYVVPAGDRCHALSSSDLATPLIALGAVALVLSRAGERRLPLEQLYDPSGLRATVLGSGNVLAAVVLPPAAGAVVFRRFAPRETVDFPTVTAALAARPDGAWARVVIGHVAARPLRVAAAEEALTAYLRGDGVTPADVAEAAIAGLDLTSSVRGSVWYKKRVLRGLVAEAAAELREEAAAQGAAGINGSGSAGGTGGH